MIADRSHYQTFMQRAGTMTDQDLGLLAMLMPMVDRAIKKFVRYNIEQTSYTHFLPEFPRMSSADAHGVVFDVRGDQAIATLVGGNREFGRLIVPELPIRSVSEVKEDRSALGGQGSSDFGSNTTLTAGTDYFVDFESSGIASSGILYRRGSLWSSRERSIKVTYTAGYTTEELNTGIAADIKLAALLTMQRVFARRGDNEGQLKSERLGDWSGTYAVENANRIPREARQLLAPFIHEGALV